MPQIIFFIADGTDPLRKCSKLWNMPLPTSRSGGGGSVLTCGSYFEAVEAFLSRNNFLNIRKSISNLLGNNFWPDKTEPVKIRLEKHGLFYHPSRIEVSVNGKIYSLVLNLAFSQEGKACLGNEFSLLRELNSLFSPSYIPRVFALGESDISPGVTVSMFLGEWFEGFHEFHYSLKTNNPMAIKIWDEKSKTGTFLSIDQEKEVFRQVAFILTYYYGMEDCRQIFPWHHAAGDFVLRLDAGRLEVKLITVRQYTSMIEAEDLDIDDKMHVLLLFFLNLSIRTRLDRIDGIGELAWAGEHSVSATVLGFFQALKTKQNQFNGSDKFLKLFILFILNFSEQDLFNMAGEIVDSYNENAPDLIIVKNNLEEHIRVLFRAVQAQNRFPQDSGDTMV